MSRAEKFCVHITYILYKIVSVLITYKIFSWYILINVASHEDGSIENLLQTKRKWYLQKAKLKRHKRPEVLIYVDVFKGVASAEKFSSLNNSMIYKTWVIWRRKFWNFGKAKDKLYWYAVLY